MTSPRPLLSPWAACDMCGRASALPAPGTLGTLCPACARLEVLTDAAEQSLTDAVAPYLGAWVAQWTRAGVPLGELLGLLKSASLYHTREEVAQPQRLATLRALGMKYAPPPVVPTMPARVTLDPAALPVIEGHTICTGTYPGTGKPYRAHVLTVRLPSGEVDTALTLASGLDALLILHAAPDGEALLYFTGLEGQAFPENYPEVLARGHALRVPARFLPAVREALGHWGSAEGGGA